MKSSIYILSSVLSLSVACVQADTIVLKGSDTLGAKMVPQLAEAYKAANPGTQFSIAAEGSTTGIAAVIDSTCDIGMSSRKAKSTEESAASAKNAKLTPTVVCYDAMAVIVNEANPLKGLSKEQVEKIFTGEITDWSGVVDLANAKRRGPGKISIYTRNTSSGTYSDFKDLAMSKRDYAPGSQKMAGNEQIASEVAKNPDGIGYVGIAYMKTPGVKALTIDGRSASPAAVKGLNYAYGRQCFYYTNGAPSGKGKPFVDFTLSPAGQKIVEQVGFIPVK
jgi:phosphate transport system substrate-binding protein